MDSFAFLLYLLFDLSIDVAENLNLVSNEWKLKHLKKKKCPTLDNQDYFYT